MTSPLDGVRVVDLTDDSGRFATKLLYEGGADVVRVTASGSPGAPMRDPGAAVRGGVLDWWYDGGKERLPLDLDDEAGRAAYRSLAAVADLVVETEPAGRLAALGIDHADLVGANQRLVQVSLTPFGREGPRAGWVVSDLVAGALGGVLSVTGEPDEPLSSFGRQAYNFGGFMAAMCGMAAVHASRRSGAGAHVDLSLHETVASSIENLFFQYFYDDVHPLPRIARRQGSLHWLGAYKVVPAATGNIMITMTPDHEALFGWMIEHGFDEVAELLAIDDVMELVARMGDVMDAITRFVATLPAGEAFAEAQRRHVAFGEVQTVAQVAANPQFAHRGLFGPAEGTDVLMPARLARLSATPLRPPAPPVAQPASVSTVVTRWAGSPPLVGGGDVRSATARSAKPLAGVRILDLTWVLAGPFCTRLLGDLGADVVKVQTGERATSVNDPEHPYYPVWNRSKRSLTIDMKHPDAARTVGELAARCDVLIENYSAGVVAGWGLGYDALAEQHPGLVYVSMSGPGHDGPWRDVISYAPTVHALCGLTHLTNPSGRGDIGLGFSLNDHAAGFAAALLVLECLHHRDATGHGQHIDMAQLEIGAYLLGPTLLDHFANDREAVPRGNVDGLHDHVPNGVYRCRDGVFVAVTCRDDAEWAALVAATGLVLPGSGTGTETEAGRRERRNAVDDALASWAVTVDGASAMELLQAAGVPAGVVQDADDLFERDPQLEARGFWAEADHPVFGTRPHDRFPAIWNGDRLDPYRPAPYLGEHDFEVLDELLGWDAERVVKAMADGLVR